MKISVLALLVGFVAGDPHLFFTPTSLVRMSPYSVVPNHLFPYSMSHGVSPYSVLNPPMRFLTPQKTIEGDEETSRNKRSADPQGLSGSSGSSGGSSNFGGSSGNFGSNMGRNFRNSNNWREGFREGMEFNQWRNNRYYQDYGMYPQGRTGHSNFNRWQMGGNYYPGWQGRTGGWNNRRMNYGNSPVVIIGEDAFDD